MNKGPSQSLTGFPAPASHLSDEAKRYFHETFSRAERDAIVLPDPTDIEAWQRRNKAELTARVPMNEQLLRDFPATLSTDILGGVRVTKIVPSCLNQEKKALMYVHGGGFVGGASDDALDSTLPLAQEMGLPIYSVDYALAPEANYETMTTQVVRALEALYKTGIEPTDIGIYGDSAGATIAGAAMLKAAASGMALPAALVLWSPWADLACTGDSYKTLQDAEPFYASATFLNTVARCYAGGADLSDPAVSILYADFPPSFLPTLIQGGTRELLVSDAIRLHRHINDCGAEAELQLYDGLWHVFQYKPIECPEAALARARTAHFFRKNLGMAGAVGRERAGR